ncbi:hypothetical protein C0993_011001, partial [Termitomyces sp. T159_Od127]
PTAVQQVHDLPGSKKGWFQGCYHRYDATVKAWEHALANNLVKDVDDTPHASLHQSPIPTTPQEPSPVLTKYMACHNHFAECDPPPPPSCRNHFAKCKFPSSPRHCNAPTSAKRHQVEVISDDEDLYLSDKSLSKHHPKLLPKRSALLSASFSTE